MSTNDWKQEMEHMLEMFDLQATHTLRKINGYFETLRRPFNEEFRQYFLKMSNQRLGMSYAKVDSESWDKQQVGLVENRDGISHQIVGNNDDRNTADDVVDIPDCFVVDPLDTSASMKENAKDASDLIEIFDSSDEDEMENSAKQGTMARKYDTMKQTASSGVAKVNNGCNGRPQNNGSSIGNGGVAGTSFQGQQNNTQQSSSSSTPIKRLKCEGSKRFKCNQCPSSYDSNQLLKQHQKMHIHERSMGIAPDRNGLYSCTHCTRKFHKIRFLMTHMSRSHKDDQYLFYCANCMSPFTRENEKKAHENQCRKRRYECHLCKIQAARQSHLEDHLRSHTGVKPFQCAVCNKFFRVKGNLKRHLDFIHGKWAQQH